MLNLFKYEHRTAIIEHNYFIYYDILEKYKARDPSRLALCQNCHLFDAMAKRMRSCTHSTAHACPPVWNKFDVFQKSWRASNY